MLDPSSLTHAACTTTPNPEPLTATTTHMLIFVLVVLPHDQPSPGSSLFWLMSRRRAIPLPVDLVVPLDATGEVLLHHPLGELVFLLPELLPQMDDQPRFTPSTDVVVVMCVLVILV